MIFEYHRPTTIDEALALLSRKEIPTIPIGGGSALSRILKKPVAVVDIQELGFDHIKDHGKILELGAAVTLQTFINSASIFSPLDEVLRHEATYNLRQVATIGGTLIAANGRSPFATALLALDVKLVLLPGDEVVDIGDFLPLCSDWLQSRLVIAARIPKNVDLCYEYVARSPADQPIVCVAVCKWPSGRTRVALGGYGESPVLAFDGTESSGAAMAAKNAYSLAEDEWARSDYRQEISSILTGRCIARLETDK
jgi:CO/xanthine dehydrogenase FAD-binding subunit